MELIIKNIVTVSSWEELCNIIREYREKGITIALKPTRWYGERETDRKTKELMDKVGKDVESITFEILDNV